MQNDDLVIIQDIDQLIALCLLFLEESKENVVNLPNSKLLQKLLPKTRNVLRGLLHKTFSKDRKELYDQLNRLRVQMKDTKINKKEELILFPPDSKETFSENYDIPLLFKLVTNFCGLTKPSNGWDEEPADGDNSEGANIVRLLIGRHHIQHSASVSNDECKKISNVMIKAMIELGSDKNEFENLQPVVEIGIFKPVYNFFGRGDEIEEIHKVCTEKIKTRLVIHGGPGLGKTEIARKYYEKYKDHFNRKVIWINGISEFTLEESFLKISEALNISTRDDTGNDRAY